MSKTGDTKGEIREILPKSGLVYSERWVQWLFMHMCVSRPALQLFFFNLSHRLRCMRSPLYYVIAVLC
jgi:hypothetical protein